MSAESTVMAMNMMCQSNWSMTMSRFSLASNWSKALIQLSCEGILDNIPRKGFLLKSTSEKEARELYQVIGALDALSAVQSCPILTEKEYSAMEYHIQSMNFAITSDNYTLYLQHQDAFHNIYLDACSSEVLSDTLHRLKSRFFSRGHTKLSDPQNAPDLRMMNDEHREILRLFAKIKQDGYSLIPLSLYFKGPRVKLEIGLAKGKKLYDKRESAARRDAKREMDRAMKTRSR